MSLCLWVKNGFKAKKSIRRQIQKRKGAQVARGIWRMGERERERKRQCVFVRVCVSVCGWVKVRESKRERKRGNGLQASAATSFRHNWIIFHQLFRSWPFSWKMICRQHSPIFFLQKSTFGKKINFSFSHLKNIWLLKAHFTAWVWGQWKEEGSWGYVKDFFTKPL